MLRWFESSQGHLTGSDMCVESITMATGCNHGPLSGGEEFITLRPHQIIESLSESLVRTRPDMPRNLHEIKRGKKPGKPDDTVKKFEDYF